MVMLWAPSPARGSPEPGALSIRADGAEEAWRVLTPVLQGWSRDLVPLTEYDAGSHDPPHHGTVPV